MSSARLQFTTSVLARIDTLVRAGHSAATIAVDVGCSSGTIVKYLRRHGLLTPAEVSGRNARSAGRGKRGCVRITPDMLPRLREMHAAGWSRIRMAAELGVIERHVEDAMRALGLPARPPGPQAGQQYNRMRRAA